MYFEFRVPLAYPRWIIDLPLSLKLWPATLRPHPPHPVWPTCPVRKSTSEPIPHVQRLVKPSLTLPTPSLTLPTPSQPLEIKHPLAPLHSPFVVTDSCTPTREHRRYEICLCYPRQRKQAHLSCRRERDRENESSKALTGQEEKSKENNV